ncbi:MAG: lmo0937 family membrane protein [Ferruginibacter sp.]
MGNITYLFAALFLIAWAVGFFVFGLGSSVHLVLVFALLLVLLRVAAGKKQNLDKI